VVFPRGGGFLLLSHRQNNGFGAHDRAPSVIMPTPQFNARFYRHAIRSRRHRRSSRHRSRAFRRNAHHNRLTRMKYSHGQWDLCVAVQHSDVPKQVNSICSLGSKRDGHNREHSGSGHTLIPRVRAPRQTQISSSDVLQFNIKGNRLGQLASRWRDVDETNPQWRLPPSSASLDYGLSNAVSRSTIDNRPIRTRWRLLNYGWSTGTM
jgi:hypothetical protein